MIYTFPLIVIVIVSIIITISAYNSKKIEIQRMDSWIQRYPQMALHYKDSEGYHPQHTWFFPPHYNRYNHLKKLTRLCKDGFGEIEMHLHHENDDEKSLKIKLQQCIQSFAEYGIFPINKATGKRQLI